MIVTFPNTKAMTDAMRAALKEVRARWLKDFYRPRP